MIRLETVNPDNWRLRLRVSDAQKALWLTVQLYWREHMRIGKAEAKRMSFITIPFLWEWHYIMTVQSLTHMT